MASTHDIVVAMPHVCFATFVVLAAAWVSYQGFEQHLPPPKPRMLPKP